MKSQMFAALLLVPSFAGSQEAITPEKYEYFCGNYGVKGTALRDRCESKLRASQGLSLCPDVKWSYECRVDEMTDAKTCSASASGSHLFVFAQKGRMSFGVIGSNFPGYAQKIRIDDNPAISFDERYGPGVAKNALIERQLRSGKDVKTRYTKWPTEISDDSKIPICDLPKVMDEMKAETRP